MTTYLDHAATTPVRDEVIAAMVEHLGSTGNPSGAHAAARAARAALDDARDVVAAALGADASEVVFTSGGTEADNLALRAWRKGADPQGTVVCSAIEHHAVLRAAERLGARQVPVGPDGVVDLDALAELLGPEVRLVSVMLVNNEVGTVQPLHKVRRLVERLAPQAVLHTDAVQAVPWLDVASFARAADLVSISAHKFGGPPGTGALVVRRGVALEPLLLGGGQERERRSGTQDVAGIIGMARAIELATAERDALVHRAAPLRDRLIDELLAAVPGAFETGERERKVSGNAHLCFPGVESEALLVLLDDAGIAASAGASCSSGAMEPSHVLTAMGIDAATAMGSLRLTLGRTTTEEDVARAVAAIVAAVERLQSAANEEAWV